MSKPLFVVKYEKWVWNHQIYLYVIDDQGMLYTTDYAQAVMTLYAPKLDKPVSEWWSDVQQNIVGTGKPCPQFDQLVKIPICSTLVQRTDAPCDFGHMSIYAYTDTDIWLLMSDDLICQDVTLIYKLLEISGLDYFLKM
jgi:hypothetical protein